MYLPGFAQDPFYINYDTKDGLPSSEVYDVHIDKNGQLWFTTDRGVSLFNGYEFKTFTTQDGLSNNTNFSIRKDAGDTLWFIDFNGTLSAYSDGGFAAYENNDILSKKLGGQWIEELYFDEKNRLYFYSTRNKTKKIYHIDREGSNIIEQLPTDWKSYEIDSKTYYVLPLKTGVFINREGDEFLKSKALRGKDGMIIFRDGEKLFRIKNGKGERIKTFHNYEILEIYIESEEKVWVCTKGGIFLYDLLHLNQPPQHFFKGFTPTSLTMDREDGYWMTTLDQGVIYIPSFQFQTLGNTSKRESISRVLTLAPLIDHLVAGSSEGEILSVNKDFELASVEVVNSMQVQNLFTQNGVVYTSFAFTLSEENGTLQVRRNYGKENLAHFRIWVKLKNGDEFRNSFPGFIATRDGQRIPLKRQLKERINFIEVDDRNKDLWLGTLNGLFKIENYDYENFSQPFEQYSILKTRISDIHIQDENMWISTIANGLFFKTTDSLYQVKLADGLVSDLINKIYAENDSTLWLGTNLGLNKVIYRFQNKNLSIKKIETYTTADGLITNYINDLIKWKDHLWLATNKGVSFFKPKDLKENNIAPYVVLDKVRVGDQNFRDSSGIELTHDQNDIEFGFTGISYKKPEKKAFYRYQLQGSVKDTSWQLTNDRNIQFTNLAPGDYTFKIAARNKYNYWTIDPVAFSFVIKPFFYETLWFKLLCLFGTIALVVLLVYLQNRRIKEKELQKRALQLAEFKTIEAELSALRSQMNPHFVYNSLNSIQNYIFKNDIKKANYYLAKFSRLMRDSLEFTKLDYLNLDKEVDFLGSYLELEKMRFGDKFDFKITQDGDIALDRFLLPPLLVQPILENAVKHAFKDITYKGILEIHFSLVKEKEAIQIVVVDNGPGINLKQLNHKGNINPRHQSLGLKIVRDRIGLLNMQNKNERASFDIYNVKTSDLESIGTRAVFLIPLVG